KIDIEDTSNNTTNVFPGAQPGTLIVNLLNLQGVNSALANLTLSPATYDEIEFEYQNATAVDKNANALSVLPQTSGSVRIKLNPAAVVTTTSSTIQIDFDVNNSISNLVLGAGGSLTLSPTVFATQQGASAPAAPVQELKGTISALTSTTLTVSARGSSFDVSIDANTSVEDVNGSVSTNVTDLALLMSIGNAVEIDGQLNASTNSILATSIEVKGATQAAVNGRTMRGLVRAINGNDISVLVTDARNSGLSAGSTQTLVASANTVFAYDRPAAAATLANLSPGQEISVNGTQASVLDAQRISLRETKLRGQVASVNSGMNLATLTLSSINKMSASLFPNVTSPVTFVFPQGVPAAVSVGATIEVEGVFNRSAQGVFDVQSAEAEGGEAEIEGKTFSVVSTNPLMLSISGEGENIGAANPATVQVVLGANALILERDKATRTTTVITASELETRIGQSQYREL
ncbi:MAG: DUF4382 domain-containing protein, partial [Planctomycetes bacterium]|nr:DUF4382 domain-containing protein [Planctomycetota bacterium]